MSLVLNGQILPKYTKIKEERVEISSKNITITGKTVKDIFRQKRVWILTYENLSQAETENLINIYALKQEVAFIIDEPNYQVYTTVLVELKGLERKWRLSHNTFELTLEEV